ncbi:Calmodulin-regulated spectrin-associated protein 2 [Cichlidogyrus casuarinus]|uniref:Calmodulin-regulated spectrin-associated protein 2 n=1 Tax=Cichlidogyrus casuarinus TaxID=1844966 RepID=A0ABD2QLM1_9PLAT
MTIELGSTDGKHFMILLRGGCQYHGLYRLDPEQNILHRLMGNGPRIIKDESILRYYKYDSGSKCFAEITTTSHLSTVVDAIMLTPKATRPPIASNFNSRFISNSTSRLQ